MNELLSGQQAPGRGGTEDELPREVAGTGRCSGRWVARADPRAPLSPEAPGTRGHPSHFLHGNPAHSFLCRTPISWRKSANGLGIGPLLHSFSKAIPLSRPTLPSRLFYTFESEAGFYKHVAFRKLSEWTFLVP